MKFLELSKERLREENKKLFDLVWKEYKFDCVIFIAKGSYLIGKDIADYANVPLLEIFAKRKGGKFKKIFQPILSIIPTKFKIALREKEVTSNYHEKNHDRDVYFDENIWNKKKKFEKILLVDDSVDTGYSIKYVIEKIKEVYPNSDIKVGAINCFNKSKKIVTTDFFLYEDTMLKGPWSNDSIENKKYLEEYKVWHTNQK